MSAHWGPALSTSPNMRSFSRFLPRSHPQKNFAETPEVLRALLIARRGRFFARPRRPDGPRRRFWARKWCPGATFSLRAGARCVLRPKSTKHCAGWRKLRFGLSALGPKSNEKSMRTPDWRGLPSSIQKCHISIPYMLVAVKN